MSSIDLPSIQTTLPTFTASSTSSTPSSSRPYRSTSPGSSAPVMAFQSRSHSISSLLSTYSSSSDRSLSLSPGPATPCDMLSRFPSFSQDSSYKPELSSRQPIHDPFSSHCHSNFSSSSSSSSYFSQRSTSSSSSSISPSVRHHPYQAHQYQRQNQRHHNHECQYPLHHNQRQQLPHVAKHFSSVYHQAQPPQYHSTSCSPSFRTLPSPSPPREMFPNYSSRNHSDYHSFHHHHHHEQKPYQHRSPYNDGNKGSLGPVDFFQIHSQTSTSSPSPSFAYHAIHPLMPASRKEERESTPLRPMVSPLPAPRSGHIRRGSSAEDEDYDEDDDQSDYAPTVSRSPSLSPTGSSFSRESSSSLSMSPSRLGSMSDASSSMTSLVSLVTSCSSSSSSSSMRMTPVPTTTQLLLCPVCGRPFKPSKNQNCNLRRHLKNVHNMSPTMHPRKCKWDSLPDGRVKDDKDRKERTRKSKRIWARKYRLRRKVEEAAEVLSMLSQAI